MVKSNEQWIGCWYNKETGQLAEMKPPDEELPEGWTLVYYREYGRFAYMELATKNIIESIDKIPGYLPPQQAQPQEPQDDAETEDKKDAQIEGMPDNNDAKGDDNNDVNNNNDGDNDGTVTDVPPQPVQPQNDAETEDKKGTQKGGESDSNDAKDGDNSTVDDSNDDKDSDDGKVPDVPPQISPVQSQPEPQQPQSQQQPPSPPQKPQQQPVQNDLPRGWTEQIDPATGAHIYINGVTTQQTLAKPPNEVLPDGWTHVYYEDEQRFAIMELATKKVVINITEIPGYVPPQVSPVQSQSQPEKKQPEQEPQQPENKLPKGWIERDQNGVKWYGNEATNQWTQVRPPNEVLPDGWYHYYVEKYKRFGYFNPSTGVTFWNFTDIPGYVPPQKPQEPQDDAEIEDKKDAQIGGEPDNNDAKGGDNNSSDDNDDGKVPSVPPQVSPVQSQQQPPSPRQEPQQPVQSDLPKGWTEQIDPATGVHIYINEVTTQQTLAKPPNEVLPDGWTHIYYENIKRFAIMELATRKVVASVNEIPGYVPPQVSPVQSQPEPQQPQPQPEPQQQPPSPPQEPQQPVQSDLPKGWTEQIDPATGAHVYTNEATTQQTLAKPPNEVLPDGWTHVYYEDLRKFAYMKVGTNIVVADITDIPGYVPPHVSPVPSQPEPQQPQQPVQSDLPKGWTEQIDPATGAHIYINGVTTQQTPVKPPNEVLPDGWTHIYYDEYQKFAIMELATRKVVASVNEIPGYVSPQVSPVQSQPEPQQPVQSDLPKGWTEQIDPATRVHVYTNEVTTQQTLAKPPNEVLPDGWTHIYYENLKRFAIMELATRKVVASVNEIPGYVPPQQVQPQVSQSQPEQKQPQNQPQQSVQSDLPKGWTEHVDPATGTHIYINEVTTQQTPLKPPNEVLPDGWTHIYYENLKRFAIMELATRNVVASVNEIPGYVPPQVSPVQSQSQPEQKQPQQPENNLPKGWIERDQNGVKWYGNEATRQWTQVRPPNEVLPDGWFHYYIEQLKKFGYYNPSTRATAMSITEIPGYVSQLRKSNF